MYNNIKLEQVKVPIKGDCFVTFSCAKDAFEFHAGSFKTSGDNDIEMKNSALYCAAILGGGQREVIPCWNIIL